MPDRSTLVTLLADPASTGGDGATTSFNGVAYSGGIVPNHGWSGDMAIDLSSLQLPDGYVPVLRNHDPDQVVGRARLSNDGKELRVVEGRFSAVTDVARETSALMGEGHPWKLSIGVNARSETADRAKPVQLNGRRMAVDTVLRNGRVIELSFVPSGADPNAYAARLSSRHGIQPPAGDSMPTDVNPLQTRVTELETQVATLTTERDTARTELATATTALAAARLQARNTRISTLFGAENELTEAQLAAYRSMSDEQFEVVETTLAAARNAAPDSTLFRARATTGRNHEGGGAQATFAAPPGVEVDPERAQLHAKALKYQAEHSGVDYLAAVAAVSH